MIICAALLVQVEGLDHTTIVPCWRHSEGFKLLQDLGYAPRTKYKVIAQGFIDNEGFFWNRESSLTIAKECGQLSQTVIWDKQDHNIDELYSEDLY